MKVQLSSAKFVPKRDAVKREKNVMNAVETC